MLTAAALAVGLAIGSGVARSTLAQSGGNPPLQNYVPCTATQVDYWSWDHYTRLWTHRCINTGDKILASEGDIVAVPQAANLSAVALIDQTFDVLAETTPTSGVAPVASEVVWGRLRKSSTCAGVDANVSDIPISAAIGCDHDTTQPTQPDAVAPENGLGSVGLWSGVTAQAAGGPVTFTWDISRWAKGDILLSVPGGFIKAFDRDLKFKRYIAVSDQQRFADPEEVGGIGQYHIPGPNSIDPHGPSSRIVKTVDAIGWGADELRPTAPYMTGCAVDFRTGEAYITNFDIFDPGLNFVGRHPGDVADLRDDVGHGSLPYADLSRRISTARFRAGDQSQNVVDAAPESAKFDRDLNLYVGHEWAWQSYDFLVADKDAPVGDGMTVAPEHIVWGLYSPEVRLGTMDANGTWLGSTTPGGVIAQTAYGPVLWDQVRVKRDPGDSAHPFNAYFEDAKVPYFSGNALDPNPFAWLLNAVADPLLDPLLRRIPWPRVIGRSLHRYIPQTDGQGKAAYPWRPASAEYYTPFTARTGVDWIDLLAPGPADVDANGRLVRKPTILYTSQSGDIYKFDMETNTQLGQWNTQRLFPSELHALRILPPGDGTDLIVAGLDRLADNPAGDFAYNMLMRVQLGQGGQATIVQTYQVKDGLGQPLVPQPEWKALDISPDGRTLVAVPGRSSDVYRFDVATGAYSVLHGAPSQTENYESQSVCILWQYNTQQEICSNAVDDDGDGIVNNGCEPVPTQPDTLVARNDAYSTKEGVTLTVGGTGVLANDGTDFTVGELTLNAIQPGALPAHGTLTANSNGSFTYVPAPGFHGVDTFRYTARRNGLDSNEAVVTIRVTPLVRDDGPFSLPHVCNASGTCQTLTINGVLANDSNNSTPMSVTMAGPTASLGTAVTGAGVHITTALGADVQIFDDGHFVYTPTPGLNNVTDTFFYEASDGVSLATNDDTALYGSSAQFAKVTVLIVNGPPVATDNSYTTEFNTPIDFRYAPCLGVADVQSGCVPNDAGNLASGLLVAGVPDSDPDLDAIAVPQWGLALDSMPPVVALGETWQAMAGKVACAGISSGFTDAYCHTAQGGLIEVWPDGKFRYYPPTGFSGEDHIFYRVTDRAAMSNWARVTIMVNARPTFPVPVAVGNAYETTTGFNLDVHYPPCFATPGQIEGVNYFPPNLLPDCPPSPTSNPNAVNGILKMSDQVVGYVDAEHLDARGVQVLQIRPAQPLPTGTLQTDWADDLSALRVHSWGELQAEMPGPVDLDLWELPEVGDNVMVCRGMAHGTIDAYCPTVLGGQLEVWADGTFRYQPPDLATPQPDWFWYRVVDGHGQVSNWAQVTINVQAKMEIHARPQTRPYGAAGPNTDGGGYYDFLLNGSFTSVPQPIARPDNMVGTLSCTAWEDNAHTTPVDQFTPVGQYDITCTGETRPGYKITYVASTLTITPVPLTVRADDKSKVYGAALPALTSSISGFVNGDTIAVVSGAADLTTTATAASGVGSYPITAEQGTLSAANYTFQFLPGTLTVTPAVLTVTAEDKTKVYGTANPALTHAPITGFVNGDTIDVVGGAAELTTTATVASAVGGYPITPTAGTLSAPNYTFAFVPGTLTVTPAVLTVTADDKAKAYGAPLPAFTATLTGFVNGDTIAVVSGAAALTTTADASSAVGSYPITAALGTLSAVNYTFQFAPGTLTVGPAVLTVTADDKSKVYGAALPALTSSISGFVNGDTMAVVSGAADLTTTATAASGVGGYPITAEQGTLAATNYTFQFVPGTLTVTPAVLTVTANNTSKPYGAPVPALTAGIAGFVNGDTIDSITGSPALSTTATAGSAVGGYPITPSAGTLAAVNYTFAFVPGTLTVTPVPLTITADDRSKQYDKTPYSPFTVQYSGFVNGDGPSAVSGLSYTGAAVGAVNVGSYAIVPTGPASSTNYSPITYVPGTLTITPAPLTVTANSFTKVIGTTYTFSGTEFTLGAGQLKPGDAVASVTLTSPGALSSAGVGTYPIVASAAVGTGLGNYVISYVDGTLTIVSVSSVRLEVVSIGGVGTFGFVDGLPGGPASFTTTAAGVPVGVTLPNVTGGVYTVTETSMPPGWFLTSIVCAGGGANTLVVGPSAVIGADPGETIVCRFTNTKSTARLATGDTATIGYWRNKNGQALILSLNGGPSSTGLATWLAASLPALYGIGSAHDLTGKTNADVAALDVLLFTTDKWAAQTLGAAIASYATSSTLAGGAYAGSYGFNLSASGTGAKLYNVGKCGATIGLANNTSYTVMQLLMQANLRTQTGTYTRSVANAFNNIFSAINEQGDIR